jgi:hypothetical protein
VKYLRAAIVSTLIGLGLSWVITTYAAPIDDLVSGYAGGTFQAGDPDYAALYAQTADRTLTLHAITDQGDRTAAIYELGYTHAGGEYRETGVMVLHHGPLRIDSYAADLDHLRASIDVSMAGQAADIGTTALALTNGFSEANPVVRWLIDHPAGIAAVVALKLGASYVADQMDISSCVAARTSIAVAGWGPGAWNFALILGATAPVAGVVGLVAAWQAYEWAQDDAPLRCAGITDTKDAE